MSTCCNGRDQLCWFIGIICRKIFVTIHNYPRWVVPHIMNMEKIRWRSCQRRSKVNCRWSCLAQSWSLSNGGNFEAERIWRRSRITWTSEESSDVPLRVGRWGTCVIILDGVRIWPLQYATQRQANPCYVSLQKKETNMFCLWSSSCYFYYSTIHVFIKKRTRHFIPENHHIIYLES